jgi:membrane-associated protease RseP (regulator of RpoE activity)
MKPLWLLATLLLSTLLMAGGSPYIGVFLEDPTDEQVKTFDSKGAMISTVISGTPAEKANLEKNTLIIRINKTDIASAAELRTAMTQYEAGDTIKVTTLAKKGKPVEHVVVLTERNSKQGYNYTFALPEDNPLGLTLNSVTPQLREFFGVPYGVMISEIEMKSAADSSGLKAGDIITKIDGAIVDSPENVRDELAKGTPGQTVKVEVNRRGERQYCNLKLNNSINKSFHFSIPGYEGGYLYDPSVGRVDISDIDNLGNAFEVYVDKAQENGKHVDKKELRKELEKLQRELRRVKRQLEDAKDEK